MSLAILLILRLFFPPICSACPSLVDCLVAVGNLKFILCTESQIL